VNENVFVHGAPPIDIVQGTTVCHYAAGSR